MILDSSAPPSDPSAPTPAANRMRETIDRMPARVTAGIRTVDLGVGRTEVLMDIPAWARNGAGRVVPGLLGILADTALGSGVTSGVAYEASMVTTHLHLALPQALPITTQRITGHARFVSRDGSFALGEGIATTEAGVVVAHMGIGSLLLEAAPHVSTAAPTAEPVPEPSSNGRHADGPVDAELATEITATSPGAITATFLARSRFANARGMLHGGFGALLGERVLDHALVHELGPHHRMRLADLRATYLRSIVAHDRPVECHGTVLHAGRRFAATRGEIRGHDGRLAILVEASYVSGPSAPPAAGDE